jgi:hypothetical protein
MSPFMEHGGGQSPKVFASTKGAPVIFYGTSRWLLAKGVCSHGPGDCPPHSLLVILVIYRLFDDPAKQLSSWCVRLMGRWVNRRLEFKSRPLLDAADCHGRRSGALDGLVNGAIQMSWYVNNDAFGQAVRAHGNIRVQDSLRPTRGK